MRKIITAIITILLIVLAVNMVINKIEIGNIEILGIKEIEKKQSNLNKKIELGNQLIKTYNSTLGNVDKSYEDLQKAKEEYEEKVKTIATSKKEEAKLLQNYSIEFLWIQIGLHAKQEGVEIDLVLTNTGASTETDLLTNKEISLYDMKFKVTGSYEAITEFIYDIEEDSKLGFGIEKFTLNPESDKTSNLVAEFTCTDVRIYKDSVNSSSTYYSNEQKENNQKTEEDTENEEENTNEKDLTNEENTQQTQ